MYQVLSCLTGEHGSLYVIAAVVVLTIGSVCTLVVFQRGLLAETKRRQRIWAGLSGVVTAVGIWATHFVAMLGYRPGFTVHFDGVTTLLSILIAVAGFVVTSQILISGLTPLRRLVCAVLATLTVSGMHFYGVGALKAAAMISFDPVYVAAAVIAGFLLFSLSYFSLSSRRRVMNLLALAGTLLAVASLHFVGMSAMEIVPLKGYADAAWEIDPMTLGAWVVLGVAAIVLMAAMAAGLDSVISNFRFQERRRLSLLVNAASEALLIARADGTVIEVNEAAESLFGQPRQALKEADINTLVGLDIAAEAVSGHRSASEHHMRVGDVSIPVDVSVRDIEEDENGLLVVSLYDLRERLANEANIRRLAFNDQLTGLPNRTAFQKALDEMWKGSARTKARFSVVLVDLDEFKDINDQFGHSAGDAVLIETAARLKVVFGDKALVSRLGGDEFAILLADGEDEEGLRKLADTCVDSLSQTVRNGSVRMRSSASVGIAVAHSHEGIVDPASLLKAADRALYAAKQDGRRTARLYDAGLHERSEKKRTLEGDLVRAVREKEFVLYYQAKVCSVSRRTLGYEALIRWQRPGHGLVNPGEFIEVAEQSTIIQDIGRWCIYEACEAAAGWEKDLTVSVNLSARQFLDPALYATVRDALRKSGIAGHRLELEITETALIQNTMVASRILEKLKTLGVQVALDDFGTGYSSMRFVQQFPFDRIKIDRSFVSSMGEDAKSFAIVDAILHLGASLSIPVVAEGVETEEQAMRLLKARCAELQGFLISRPGPLAGLPEASRIAPAKAS
ncbi:bifunctional diguanylate cyclase/phosphodiesterase [Henriciella aquimarina]|uniref:bifunctional diguanylate cyclase/phosphodiesterase n=1 Tax=Henriciella aquimarina TaxID=545261 RepID=UPI000A0323DA|nr:EAL domain-containing protein [Henriciella aquimarina]